MQSIKNPIDLPAVALRAVDLKKLQMRLESSLHLPTITITISREGTDHKYESLDSVISDKLSPSLVRSFEIRFDSTGGKGRIAANSTENDKHLLYTVGYSQWCNHIQTEIMDFMAEREALLRSKLSGKYWMAPISAMSTILVGQLYTTLSPFGIFYPASHNIPTILFFLLISSVAFFMSTFRHYFFPYAYWDISKGRRVDIYLRSTLEIFGLSALLILSVFILNFVFDGSVPF